MPQTTGGTGPSAETKPRAQGPLVLVAALVGIVVVIFIETGLLFPILPGDSLLFTAGALVAQDSLQISLPVLLALLFQWYASEERQARRSDRAADRDGDKELAAYNAYLASLNTRGG